MSYMAEKFENVTGLFRHSKRILMASVMLPLLSLLFACAEETDLTAAKPDNGFTVTASAGVGGNISPSSQVVKPNETASFSVTANANYSIANVTGCNGALNQNNVYITGPITANCSVSASFQLNAPITHNVTTNAGAGGSIAPGSATVNHNATTSFTITPDANYVIQSVSGCNGSLSGNVYTTGPIVADCVVAASFSLSAQNYTVSATVVSGNGIISPASASVSDGASTQFTLSPSIGYQIDSVTGCAGTLSGNTYTTGPIHADCQVSVSFKILTFTVSAQAGPGGSVTPPSVVVNYNQRASFTVTPDPHYVVASVSGCGRSPSLTGLSGNTYTTRNIRTDCQVQVNFALQQFVVTANAGLGGSLAPASATVNYGASATFTVTPDPNYSIVSVTGCGGSLQGNTYTTGAITLDCSVNASFIINSYTVTATAASGGSISPASVTVNHGDVTTFTVLPDANFSIDVVSGCGGSLTPATLTTPAIYTTAPVTGACAVAASFVALTQTLFTLNAAVDVSAGGTVTPATIDVVLDASASFVLQPDANYRVATVAGCKGNLSNNTYTSGPVSANCNVLASFVTPASGVLHTVNTAPSDGGDVAPNAVRLIEGTRVTFTVTPDPGYQLGSILPSGCDGILTGNSYQTQDISNECNIRFNFTATLTVAGLSVASLGSGAATNSASYLFYGEAGAGGALTPLIANVLEGGSVDFVITPDPGYDIDTVSGCGGYLIGNTYTSAAASASYDGCTVTATFKPSLP